MNYLNKVKSHPYIVICILILIVATVFFVRKDSSNGASTYTVVAKDIAESINVSGKIKASNSSNLNFERSGVVSSIDVKVGDKVYKGKVLASLSSADLVAQVSEAKAALESAEANLKSTTEGSRPEEIAIKEQALASAQSDYDLQSSQAVDTINNTLNTYNDILYFKLSSLFTQNSGDNYKYTVNNCDQSLVSKIELNYKNAISDYNDLKKLDTVNYTDKVLSIAKNQIELKNLINNASLAVTSNCVTNDSSVTSARTYISSAKASLTSAINELNARINSINTSKNAVDRATKDLALSRAGGDKNKIDVQAAAVSQASSRLASAQAQLAKNMIVSPFDGIITSVSIDLGELAAATKSAISVMTQNSYELEIKLSEIDAVKIMNNQAANITLDAFGDTLHWTGIVSRIDPSATNNNGVSNYRAIISFSNAENIDKIKAGMTANAKLTTNKKSYVISIPSKYLKNSADKILVQVKKDNKITEKEVTVGIRSDDGYVEILTGLESGDIVQSYTK